MNAIPQFHAYDALLASAGQPAPEHFQQLAQEGYAAVVNLSTPDARNALSNEALLVQQSGMQYLHFPIDCTALKPQHYLIFRGIMDGLKGKKVLVHCGANIKSSAMLQLYRSLSKGQNPGLSLDELHQIQQPEQKWLNYFEETAKTHGI